LVSLGLVLRNQTYYPARYTAIDQYLTIIKLDPAPSAELS